MILITYCQIYCKITVAFLPILCYNKCMERKFIEKLKDQICDFINEGGDLYETTNVKQLPFYESINYLRKSSNGQIHSFAEAMAFLGFDYDQEFARYQKMNEILLSYADEDNFVDEIKKHRGENADTTLKEFAKQLDCTPSDYLLLMTDFRYRNASKKADYINELIDRIYTLYPDGNISSFRHKRPELYHAIRNVLLQAHGEFASMSDLAELLGVYLNENNNHKFSNKQIRQSINENQVVEEYKQKVADGRIKSISNDDPALYHKIYICAIRNNTTVYQWFVMHNLTPPANTIKTNTNRLSRIKVDPFEREAEIRAKQKEIIERDNLSLPEKPADQYHFRKALAKQVLKELDKSNDLSNALKAIEEESEPGA